MNHLRLFIVLIILSIFSCDDNILSLDNQNLSTKDEIVPLTGYEEVTLTDLTDIDCCSFVFVKKDGKYLDPINLKDFSTKYIDGNKYWIKYKIAYGWFGCCMVGDIIEIVDLKEIE